MKLIIQLPCYNEEETLPVTLSNLPRSVAGFDRVEWLVVDDGSTDGTAAVAHSLGVDYVIAHASNLGLARAFMTGIQAALERGADVIVNTDADNQYNAADIPALVRPILDHKADMVIGTRPDSRMPRFALVRLVHAFGCLVVRLASNTDIPDAPSGFRAFTRSTAKQLRVFDAYTYTLETIIQAGYMKIPLTAVPIRVNAQLRSSRLISSIPNYILRSALTIIRTFALYRPRQLFIPVAIILFAMGWFLMPASMAGAVFMVALGCIFLMFSVAIELLPARKFIRAELKHKTGDDKGNSPADGGSEWN